MYMFTYSNLRTVVTALLLSGLVAFFAPIMVDAERSDSEGISVVKPIDKATPEANVCDGVTCSDGSCAATADMCGDVEMSADSVCDGYLCDSGECASSAAMCGLLDEEVDMAADSVCNGYLCDNGDCATSEAMCGVVDEIDMAVDSVCNGFVCDSGQCVSDEVWCGVEFDFEIDAAVTAADSVCNGYLCNDGTCVSSQAMCGLDLEADVAKCPADSPIRCGDGSCSSEVDRCLAIEDRVIREGGRTVGAGAAPEQAQNHNSSRSNETEGVTPDDADGDGYGDTDERANYNNSRSNRATVSDPDSDDDGLADGTEATRAIFTDTDADGRPEVSLRGNSFVAVEGSEGAATGGGRVKCWSRAEAEDGNVYAWGQGICIAGEAAAGASETAQARLAALQVRGDDVRGWSEEQQAAWRTFRESRTTTTPEERLVERMVETTKQNERIQEITSDDESIGMRYRAEMRLFGFIPMERSVTAQVAADGEVEVDYPWYRFLTRVPEKDVVRDTMSELQTLLQASRLDKTTPKLAE